MDTSSRQRSELFPSIEPFDHGMLPVGSGHEVYWEQSGNPAGVPVIFLHGGPGAGAGPGHRRFFDPAHYRIVIFDQRGAGRSKPCASVANNTTADLCRDIERLREHLNVEQWLVFGGSWGSALAIYYGIHHPGRCLGFILRGIFMCRAKELDWFLYKMGSVFPEAWRAFRNFLPDDERPRLLASYYRRLTDPDPAVHGPAARAWSGYENACSRLLPTAHGSGGSGALDLARIEAHYFVNDMFMEEGFLFKYIGKITHLSAVIVQGRYDMVCPIATADELARAWPGIDYVIVPDAGHSTLEAGIRAALVGATEAFKNHTHAF